MSTSALRRAVAIRDPRVPSSARLLHVVLVGHAKQGKVGLQQKDLLALTNLDPRTARKGISALQDLGYLINTGRVGHTPIYRVAFPTPTQPPEDL
jgi:hypothetical protein